VAAELRTSLARGGLPAAQEADVWSSPGVTVEGERTSAHGLAVLVWLYGGTGVLGRDCYEFRVAEGRPANVTFKKLELKPAMLLRAGVLGDQKEYPKQTSEAQAGVISLP